MSDQFAERLRLLRMDRGLTQNQLADRMFINRSTVARWESGSRVPDLVLLPRLARCLGVDVALLIPSEDFSRNPPVVIVVDDEPIILSGELNTLGEALPDAEITGFIRSAEALEFARNNRVDMAFLDIEMGSANGFEVCKKLLELNPATNVVYLTAYPDYALKAWETGARGFMVKPLIAEEVIKQLEKYGGGVYFRRKKGGIKGECADHAD